MKLYEFYGINFIDFLEGIYSIIIHDKNLNKVFFIRDRFGEKPLFIFHDSNQTIVSSEIRIIKKIKKLEINKKSIISYLRHNYIIGPKTIYKNLKHIEPGSYVEFNLNNNNLRSIKYFDLIEKLNSNKKVLKPTDFNESIKLKTVSDVGYSVLLSAE